MNRYWRYLEPVLISLLLMSRACAQTAENGNSSPGAALAATDMRTVETELLSEMHAANLIEIRVGELAQSKGAIAEIRNFGVLLVRDHGDADRRIQDLAKKQGLRLTKPTPKTLEEQHKVEALRQEFSALESLDGPKFDTEFIEFNDTAHRMLLQLLQRDSQQLKPSPVKTLIRKEVPILQQHEFLCSWCRDHCLNQKR